MNSTYIVILSLYMLLSMVIAFMAARKNTRNAGDYNVGGRSFGPEVYAAPPSGIRRVFISNK